MKRKIILDCDPGHDDAFAILLAGNNPAFDLLGITVSSSILRIRYTSLFRC